MNAPDQECAPHSFARLVATRNRRHLGRTGTISHPRRCGWLRETDNSLTAGYFEALTAYRHGDALPIVQRFADASRFAATSGRRLIDSITDRLDADKVLLAGLRPHATAWRVLPWLAAHPVLNARLLVDDLRLTDVAAQRVLAQLTQAGVLTERTGHRRNRIWQHGGILAILDDYAASLRRQ